MAVGDGVVLATRGQALFSAVGLEDGVVLLAWRGLVEFWGEVGYHGPELQPVP